MTFELFRVSQTRLILYPTIKIVVMVRNIQQVLISDPVDPICAQILQEHGMNVTYACQWTKEKLLQEIQVYLTV